MIALNGGPCRLMLRAAAIAAFALTLTAGGVEAQQPSKEQIDAIKSSCRSDFMSNCFGVKTGGVGAFRCLREHLAKLSPACGTAVSAAIPKPPPPAAVAAPAPAPPAAVVPPPAPVVAAPAAVAPAVPPVVTKPAEVAQPKAEKPKAEKPKAATQKAAPAPAPAQAVAAPPPAPEPPYPVAKFEKLPLPKRLAVIRACTADRDVLCEDVKAGDGRIIECLAAHRGALSQPCQQVMMKAVE